MTTPITATGFYLEYTDGTSNKFYVGIVAERFSITNWGRIGSAGQTKVDRMPSIADAEAIVRRQSYQKAAKGYTMLVEGLKFSTDFDTLADSEWDTIYAFHEARKTTPHAAQADAIIRDYEELSKLFDGTAEKFTDSSDMDAMSADLDTMRAEFARVSSAHYECEARLNLLASRMVEALMKNVG